MHHELPQRLDLDWYRKEAKRLVRAYRARDAGTIDRVRGGRGARERFALGDAQHLIAVEHGFASWADFKRWVEEREPEPPVGRIGTTPVSTYEERAEELLDAFRASDQGAARRVAAHLPRPIGSQLSPRDARIVVAHEYGFPTWRDLERYVGKAYAEAQAPPDREFARALALVHAGDVDEFRRLLAEQPELALERHKPSAAPVDPTTLLEELAQPGYAGADLAFAEVVVDAGGEVDVPLNIAACFNRAELVRLLLAAGARHDAIEIWGITPLQSAIYHGAKEAADVLADVALVPDAFWVAAGAGWLDRLAEWFGADGRLRDEALTVRPNRSDVGWPPAPPPRDVPQDALDEAFALACYSGRIEAMRFLHERGSDPSGSVHLGLTGLHLAVIARRPDVARWLVEHGADREAKDGIHHRSPLEWARHTAPDSGVDRFLESV
jgi:hypothetical protein